MVHKRGQKYSKVLFVEMRYPRELEAPKEVKEDNSFYFQNYRTQDPLDILFPATVLKKNGVSVCVIDLNYETDNDIEKRVKSFKPDLVLLSTAYICYWQCPPWPAPIKENVENIRKFFSGQIGIFGPHSTALPEKTLRMSSADFAIVGEPEPAILDIEKNGVGAAEGVCFIDSKGNFVIKRQGSLFNMKKMPIPDYNLMDLSKYSEVVVQSSRGCPAHCVFCNKSMYGPGYRQRNIADVISEIKTLKKNGINKIYFQELEFLFNEERVEKFCKALLKSKVGVKWSCTARVNSVKDLRVFNLMKKAGCETINFGLESGSESVIQKSAKAITLQQVEHSMELCEKSGIIGAYNIIFGLPGENKKTMKETAAFIKKHYGKKNVRIDRGFRVIYFPGSKLFDVALADGALKDSSLFRDIYLSSGTVETSFLSKRDFDKAFQRMRIGLFIFKLLRRSKSKLFRNKD